MSFANVEVVPAARHQAPILANLLELYIYDFSEFHKVSLGEDGRFGYKQLPLYWREPHRNAFFLKCDGKLAGFALVNKGSKITNDASVWDMAEFFVIRAYRRHGVGIRSARQLWNHFPGRWEIRVLNENHVAHQFWAHAIAAFAGKTISSVAVEKGGRSWRVFSFDSPGAP